MCGIIGSFYFKVLLRFYVILKGYKVFMFKTRTSPSFLWINLFTPEFMKEYMN